MSSSSRSAGSLMMLRVGVCGSGIACVFLAGTGRAAEVFVQPIVSELTVYNSNVELSPFASDKQSAVSYTPDVAALIGIATQTSETTIRPDVRYAYYPVDKSLNRLEATLDFNSAYTAQRDRFSIAGRFDRRDDLNAENPGAGFNPVNPENPVTPTTGRVQLGVVRDYEYVAPSYGHNLTPLTSVGITGLVQGIQFSPSDPFDHVNFNYYQAEPYFNWVYNARTNISISPFAARFEAQNIQSHSDAYGSEADLRYNWSPILRTTFTLLYQQTKIDQTTPTPFVNTSNNWGGSVETEYKGVANQVHVNFGRQIQPSSGGALYNTDQLQLEWNRQITARLQFTGAQLYQRSGTLDAAYANDTRTYTVTQVYLRWMVTRVIFVKGGYSYQWQRYQNDPNGANNNAVSFQFGYIGLAPQQ